MQAARTQKTASAILQRQVRKAVKKRYTEERELILDTPKTAHHQMKNNYVYRQHKSLCSIFDKSRALKEVL